MKAPIETLYWYHGRITRDAATHILQSQARNHHRDGCFLVRDCSSAPGDFVISILAHNQILHYQVHCNGDNRFSVDDGPVFQGLETLISHYQVTSDGLPCRLTTFCRGSLPPPQALKFGIDTPLHKACHDGNTAQTVKLLSEMYSHQQVDARNEQGLSPLQIASGRGHEEIILLLLNYGADVKAASSSGTTALQVNTSKPTSFVSNGDEQSLLYQKVCVWHRFQIKDPFHLNSMPKAGKNSVVHGKPFGSIDI